MTPDICSNKNGVDPNQLASQQDQHHFLNNMQVCVHNQTMDSVHNQTLDCVHNQRWTVFIIKRWTVNCLKIKL